MHADAIVKRYGAREALRGVSFEVAAGEKVAVIGPNGAGKTTLLKVLSRITPPTEGRVVLRGRVAPMLESASILMRIRICS